MAEEKKDNLTKSSETKKTVKKESTSKKTTVKPKIEGKTVVDTTKIKEVKNDVKEEKTEEVKLEKKFCTKCGKELEINETCTCIEKDKEVVSIDTQALKNAGKSYLNLVLNMYKKPSTTLKEETEKGDIKTSLIMLIFIAISFGIYVIALLSQSISNSPLGEFSLNVNNLAEIPYLKIFLYMTIIYYVIAFVPILVALAAAKITGNKDFNINKSISLYITSMTPTIFTNILMALLYYLNILPWVGTIIGCIISIACFFHFILGFLNKTKIEENKKSYTLTGIIISWVVVAIIIVAIVFASVFNNLYNKNDYISGNNYNDMFNW